MLHVYVPECVSSSKDADELKTDYYFKHKVDRVDDGAGDKGGEERKRDPDRKKGSGDDFTHKLYYVYSSQCFKHRPELRFLMK